MPSEPDRLDVELATHLGTWCTQWVCLRCGPVADDEVSDERTDGHESWHVAYGCCGERCDPLGVAPNYCASLDAAAGALDVLELDWAYDPTKFSVHVMERWNRSGRIHGPGFVVNQRGTDAKPQTLATALVPGALLTLQGKGG